MRTTECLPVMPEMVTYNTFKLFIHGVGMFIKVLMFEFV